MEKLLNDFSVGLFFWQTVLFLALLFLLRKYAWKPILESVNKREASIDQALKAADEARAQMDKLKSDNEQLLQQARVERDSILKEAKEIKDATINDAKKKAVEEAQKIIDGAKESIEKEKVQALNELKDQVATFSVEIAEKILRKEFEDPKQQASLIDQELKSMNLN